MISIIVWLIGIGLLVSTTAYWFKMKGEVLKGKSVIWINFGPYFDHKNLTDKGQTYRKKYNQLYFLLIAYLGVIYILKNYYGR